MCSPALSDDEDKQEVNVDLRSSEGGSEGGEQTGPETENGMDTSVQSSAIGEEENKDDEAAGGASEGEGGEQEPATAVMINKALKKFGKRIIVQADARECLQEISWDFLGGLLGRPLLTGSMDQNNVKKAINDWIPQQGVGNKMRFLFSTQSPNDFGCCSAIKLKHKK